MRFTGSPLYSSFGPWLGGVLSLAGWKIERKAWKAHAKAMRRAARAESRAARWRNPFRAVWGLMWALFWVAFVLWFVLGGSEARRLTFDFVYGVVDWFRGLFVSLTGKIQ